MIDLIDLKPWVLELLSLGGTLGITAALVVLLATFNGKSVFDWNSITLNTIISTLSVVMKALMLFSVAECIGQWKWILLHHDKRKLYEFERIDQASRGPLGCFDMTWRKDTPWLLRVGLVVTVLTIAVDPFSQQLVQIDQGITYISDINGTQATSPHTSNYLLGSVGISNTTNSTINPEGPQVQIMGAEADLSLKAAVLNGLVQPKNITQQQVNAVCPTGNCTWEKFETLGVCHRCADLTDKLELVEDFGEFFNYWTDEMHKTEERRAYRPENATALSLPNGHFLANVNNCVMTDANPRLVCSWGSPGVGWMDSVLYSMTSYGTGNPSRTNSFKDLDTLIWSISVIHIDEHDGKSFPYERGNMGEDGEDAKLNPWAYWPTIPVGAIECALYYCVKEIESRFEGNTLYEKSTEAKNVSRTPESFQPIQGGDDIELSHAPENIPNSYGVLEFHDRYSSIWCQDLTLNHTNATGFTRSYVVSEYAVKSISSFFQDTLRYPWENETEALEYVRKRIPRADALWNGMISGVSALPNTVGGIWTKSESNVEERFETLAMSMTNDIRKKGGRQAGYFDLARGIMDFGSIDPPIIGKIGIPTTQYRVVWYWITLHGVTIFGSVAFCVLTVLYSRDVPVWKSHSLATMSHGPTIIDFSPELGTLKELEKKAKTVDVSLAGVERSQLFRRKGASPAGRDGHSTPRDDSPRPDDVDLECNVCR